MRYKPYSLDYNMYYWMTYDRFCVWVVCCCFYDRYRSQSDRFVRHVMPHILIFLVIPYTLILQIGYSYIDNANKLSHKINYFAVSSILIISCVCAKWRAQFHSIVHHLILQRIHRQYHYLQKLVHIVCTHRLNDKSNLNIGPLSILFSLLTNIQSLHS